jgi:polyisoprenyl-teichoic acid--peptidoglycan teichoic acid transferase
VREKSQYQYSPYKIRTLSDQRFLIAWIITSFIASLLITGTVAAKSLVVFVPGTNGEGPKIIPTIPPWEAFHTDKLVFVLLGYDAVDEFAHRSDTLMVGAVDFAAPSVRIVSIPRDTLAVIPKHGFEKINAAYALGHEDLVRQTVEKMLGVKVDYVVAVNYQGFVGVVDALGGVNITVDKAMNYDDRRGNLHIHFKPGEYHMDGQQALEYARFRHDATGDLGRIQRQQIFIKALLEQAVRFENWPRLQKASQVFLSNMTIAINPDSPRRVPPIEFDQILGIMGFLSQLDSNQIKFYQVPCDDVHWHGQDCLRPKYDEWRVILKEVFKNDASAGWEKQASDLNLDPSKSENGKSDPLTH